MAISYDVQDGIAIIKFNNPAKLNALTLAMYEELANSFKRAAGDPKVAVCILTGEGEKSFCVGADLDESIPFLMEGNHDISEWDDTHLKNTQMFKPIIGAVNGYCFGGGLEILLSTDIRISSNTALFGFPEVGIGVVPAGGTLVRLVRQISYARTMELILTGRKFSAVEALSYGILNEVVEPSELMDHALCYAEMILDNSANAVQVAKESVIRLMSLPMEAAFHEEALWGQRAFTNKDAEEGIKAFFENRKPKFPSKNW
ncbi:enoyl-CoA hydratase [Pueribacillus theae]|uniref:Enoyl-CoA hydratase n=1 Tax=Pueribacillus theae TaxID=2171751 RepID=A0A2U1JVI0_9BACI|nr:enoyl-CoA hydratase/isomerase family protein [Pueribacillus theae]PWA09220.1 enoyl-CoA hydratase [Pueribacillus theae]